jgi:predicted MFS family arabinose efflux permease
VGAYVLPGAISAVALGRWLRPLSARRLVIADAVVRGALLGAIPAAYVLGALTPAVYVALLGLSSLLHAWGKAARQALFVPLLPERLRLAANAVLSTSLWVSTIAGPVAAGVLAGVASPVWIVGADAVTFVAVAVRVWHTLLPEADGAVPPRSADRPVLFRRAELVGSMALTWFFNLSFGPVEVALPLFVSRTLLGGPALLGAYWAAFGAGAAIGALGLAAARRLPLWPAMLGVIAGHGLALLPFAVSGSAVPSLIGFTLAGVIYGPYTALSLSHLQEQVAPQDLTTVLAARSAVLLTAAPLGAFVGGAVVDRIGAPVLLAGCGAAMLAIATASALVLATRSRTAGESVVARPPTEA